jgi:PleD family two-component response regulator
MSQLLLTWFGRAHFKIVNASGFADNEAMQSDSLTGLSILVVEDEVLLRKQIVAALERLGADVTAAGTLQAARQFIADLEAMLTHVSLEIRRIAGFALTFLIPSR